MAALAAMIASAASADPRLCRELAHELDLLALSEPASPEPGSEDPAVGRQLDRLLEAEREAELAGCGSGRADRSAECRVLELSISQMSKNLARLEGESDSFRNSDVHADERALLLAALAENGCDAEQDEGLATDRNAPEGARLTRIYGGRIESDPDEDLQGRSLPRILHPGDLIDRTRQAVSTFCVRTCDGYVFPLSQTAWRDDFARDQASCQAACPGTATELFYRAGPSGGDADLMTSAATGQLYMDLPTAGLYRRAEFKRPPSCSCTAGAMPRNFQVMTASPSAGFELRQSLGPDPSPAAPSGSVVVIEAPARPQPAPALAPAMAKRHDAGPPDPQRKVRVVGPAFFPAPAAAAAPQAPAPTPAR